MARYLVLPMFVLVFTFATIVRAQTEVIACPSIAVTGPSGITQPGELMSFTGNLDGNGPKGLKFRWSVTGGKIAYGQDTLHLKVSGDWTHGASVTATMEVIGLPVGCPASASETGGFTVDPSPLLIDVFGNLSSNNLKFRMNRFFIELRNNPNNQGYIINYGTDKAVAIRERLILKHLTFRSFDRNRITLVRGGDNEGRIKTKLYRIPPGADNPAP